MKIINNGRVDRTGAYYESGGLVIESQRIVSSHQNKYWQQANYETTLAVSPNLFKDVEKICNVDEAIYVGRIPTHLGHFIMEAMPRLCDIVNINKPIIGYITDGVLPSGILPTPESEIRWIIKSASNEIFYEISENETYIVKKLYVPTLPYQLSYSCSEPWRMSSLINKIVSCAREENLDITSDKTFYLSRYEDLVNIQGGTHHMSNPNEKISTQIAKISNADSLHGKIGSNTHMSIFAKWNTLTNWTPRGSYTESDRNQLICDLVKTYNTFK